MQDKLAKRSVLGLYEHGTVAGTTLVRRLHSVSNAPALKTHVYTLTHLDHSTHQHCCARERPHTVDLPPHQRGRGTGMGGARERGADKGDIDILGVCENTTHVHTLTH